MGRGQQRSTAESLADLDQQSASQPAVDEPAARHALRQFTPVWAKLTPAEQRRVLELLVERIEHDGAGGEMTITFHPGGLAAVGNWNEGDAS